MFTAIFTREIDLPAPNLWALMRDFGNLSWMDNVDKVDVEGEGIGMVRTILTGDGITVTETLTTRDDDAMHMAYSIPDDLPLPINHYSAHLTITALTATRCRIDWHGSGEPDGISEAEADAMLKGAYGGFVQNAYGHLTAKR